MEFTPKRLKRMLNLYPRYLGAGVKVTYISEDWKELHVSMSLRWKGDRGWDRSDGSGGSGGSGSADRGRTKLIICKQTLLWSADRRIGVGPS